MRKKEEKAKVSRGKGRRESGWEGERNATYSNLIASLSFRKVSEAFERKMVPVSMFC